MNGPLPPTWLKRAAISWSADISSDSESSPYWDPTLLSQISSLSCSFCPGTVVSGTESKDGQVNVRNCCISYESLLIIAALIVDSLRRIIQSYTFENQTRDKEIGIPVAVAIPEGPLLAIAILAVHVLGEPQPVSEGGNGSTYAILVPIEPSEGRERLRHMINDSQPAIVLCLPGQDTSRIEQVCCSKEAVGIDLSKDSLSKVQLRQTQIIDFSQLIRDSIRNWEKKSLSIVSPQVMNKYTAGNELDHQADFFNQISMCAMFMRTKNAQHENIPQKLDQSKNRISHIVYTSGTTGAPKGCISSIRSLQNYLGVKNEVHEISSESTVLLASALSFDPCLSDVLATFQALGTLALPLRKQLVQSLATILSQLEITHILCTPTLWSMVQSAGMQPKDFPSLKVIALGGEPIPNRIARTWARDKRWGLHKFQASPRLLATYGVTEACIYQTCGEILQDNLCAGQNVGTPFPGLFVEIWPEPDGEKLTAEVVGLSQRDVVGEVVFHGNQLDEHSAYLNRPDLSKEKFVRKVVDFQNDQSPLCQVTYCYRTGDRAFINRETNNLHILGRIQGEEGMVKVNGVRVELGEVESALVDEHTPQNSNYCVVTDCVAVVIPVDSANHDSRKQIYAYCVLSSDCSNEMNLFENTESDPKGILCTSGALLQLFRGRCMERVKPGCVPSAYIIIKRLPLSPTGKCDRRGLPSLKECIPMETLHLKGYSDIPLWEYGVAGAVVSEHVKDHLNLQPCQMNMLTKTANFAMLGGDSLAATSVVRALYAQHNGVSNSRWLGGSYGVLDGPFAVSHLLRADTLGQYVDFLDSHCVCPTQQQTKAGGLGDQIAAEDDEKNGNEADLRASRMHDALLQAITLQHSNVAMALLDLGVDPNCGEHGGRLSKADRRARKKTFKSNPLHLACGRGDSKLTKTLIEKGCKFTSPDAAGSYPMLLACSGVNNKSPQDVVEDLNRKECVALLLEAGAPLGMKDGNKQTVLHSAARSGHCELLKFLMESWKEAGDRKEIKVYDQAHKGGRFDWTDRWFRTPVHWAVLNANVESLKILLQSGCSANPPKPKTSGSQRQTSVAIESPLEVCIRLYGETNGIGKEISTILKDEM